MQPANTFLHRTFSEFLDPCGSAFATDKSCDGYCSYLPTSHRDFILDFNWTAIKVGTGNLMVIAIRFGQCMCREGLLKKGLGTSGDFGFGDG